MERRDVRSIGNYYYMGLFGLGGKPKQIGARGGGNGTGRRRGR